MPPHPLTNFEIQKYYQNKPKFNGVFSRDIVTHWIVLWVNNNNVTYFDSFGVGHRNILKKFKNLLKIII